LIVSHPARTARRLESIVESALGEHALQQRLTPLLLDLRYEH
jgi:hypothetical protein